MGRSRKRFNNQNNNQRGFSDGKSNHERSQSPNQHRHRNRRPLKRSIVVLLENGSSFEAKMVAFDHPNMPRCKVFFKSDSKRELCIAADIVINSSATSDPAKSSVLQSTINNYLTQLHDEAMLEFPQWLEKYSTRTGETNPFFNLDEIREEYKYKKSRYGIWCIAAKAGFFSETKPLTAKFNKIMHLEIREQIVDMQNQDKSLY